MNKWFSLVLIFTALTMVLSGIIFMPDPNQMPNCITPDHTSAYCIFLILIGLIIFMKVITDVMLNPSVEKKMDMVKDAYEVSQMFNDDSKFRCQKCKALLPFLRTILKAKSVNNLESFEMKCKKCGYINLIKKEFGNDQCFKCGKIIDGSKGNICDKCFRKEKRISER